MECRVMRAAGAALLCLALLATSAGAVPDDEAKPAAEPESTEEPTAEDAEKAAAEKAATRVLATLEKSFSKIRTVDTAFTQKKVLKILKRPITLEGHIYIEFPDKLAWHVTKPLAYSLILTKDELRQWDEDTEEVQTVSLSSNPAFKTVTQQLNVWFSGKYSQLVSEYEVTVVAEKPALRLRFVPREKSMAKKAVKTVEVAFATDRAYVQSIRFEDTTGDVTTLSFTETKLNQAIPKAAWDLRPGGD